MGKIIVTADGNIPSIFAHSFNVMKVAQGFFQNGYEVEVVTLLTWPIIKNIFKNTNIYNHYGVDKKIKIKFIPVFNKDFFNRAINARTFNKKCIKYIKKKSPLFVYCRSYKTTVECINNNILCFMEAHTTNVLNQDLQSVFKLSTNKNLLGIVTIHEKIKSLYIEQAVPESKISVLDDGVDIERFNIIDDKKIWRKKLKIKTNVKMLLYSGSLYKEKGIENILNIKKELNEFVLVIIGGNLEQVKEWKEYCKLNDIQNVVFKGFLPNAVLPQYFKASDILLMPYDNLDKYKVMDINSTSPLKLFEYIASNRPVISSDIPVITKVVKHKDSAMLAPLGNIELNVENIKELMKNNTLYSNISEKAVEISKKYSWTNRCSKVLSIYNKNK